MVSEGRGAAHAHTEGGTGVGGDDAILRRHGDGGQAGGKIGARPTGGGRLRAPVGRITAVSQTVQALQGIAGGIAAAGPGRLIRVDHFIHDHPAHRIIRAVGMLWFFQRKAVGVVGQLAGIGAEDDGPRIGDAVKVLERGQLRGVRRRIEIHHEQITVGGQGEVGRKGEARAAVETPGAVGVVQGDRTGRGVVQFDELIERVVREVGAHQEVRRMIHHLVDDHAGRRCGIGRIAGARRESIPVGATIGITSQ